MKFRIYRGTKEIGGSCVEISTDSTRIIVDFGMPLVDSLGNEFNFNHHKNKSAQELINESILPDITGLYNQEANKVDAVVISHAHQDHYGLLNYIGPDVPAYLSEPTRKLIEINNLYTPQNIKLHNPRYFIREQTFKIGDISITPYWADHSAFDAHSFLIEADGKSIFYTGDFRAHGRKLKTFYWLTKTFNKKVNYLLLEGTTIGNQSHEHITESEIEERLVDTFKKHDGIQLIYASGQNIDRLVSIYRACVRTDKIMAVDVYIASVLKALSLYAKIPYPSKDFKNLKVYFPYYASKRLSNQKQEKILYQFKDFKITREEIDAEPEKMVMLVRPSIQIDLKKLNNIDGGNFIYSMWGGYRSKPDTKKFLDYLKSRNFSDESIHTSGHADVQTLKKLVKALNPEYIVPIHTFAGDDFKDIFSQPIMRMKDGELKKL